MLNITILIVSLIIFVLFLFFKFISTLKEFLFKYTLLNKYKNYEEVLSVFLEKAYDIIYKDQIVTYHASGVSVQSDELETSKRNFIKLTFDLMGPNIQSLYIEFFGNRETLISNMLLFFQKRIDDDKLLQLTQEAMNNKENDKG